MLFLKLKWCTKCLRINSFSMYFLFRIFVMDEESCLRREEGFAWKQSGPLETEMPNTAQYESEVRRLSSTKTNFIDLKLSYCQNVKWKPHVLFHLCKEDLFFNCIGNKMLEKVNIFQDFLLHETWDCNIQIAVVFHACSWHSLTKNIVFMLGCNYPYIPTKFLQKNYQYLD